MKWKTFLTICIYTVICVNVKCDESCQNILEACNNTREYNTYIDCLKEIRKQNKDSGCFYESEMSCEYFDCSQCTDCVKEGNCEPVCYKCCTEICTDQLCCVKTCNYQCKTNYCR